MASEEPYLSVPQEPETTAQLVELLDAVPSLYDRINAQARLAPDPGSAARSDRVNTADWTYSDTSILAATFLVAAADHLAAWRALVVAKYQPAFSHMSLIRTAMETASSAYWLVEPGVDSSERRIRMFAAQYATLDERRKFEAATGLVPDPPGKAASVRQRELIGIAEATGLTTTNSKGRTVLARPMPGAIELFDLYESVREGAKPSWLYRFLSGYAHGYQWAMVSNASGSGRELGPNIRVAMLSAHDSTAVQVTAYGVRAVRRAVDAYVAYRTAAR